MKRFVAVRSSRHLPSPRVLILAVAAIAGCHPNPGSGDAGADGGGDGGSLTCPSLTTGTCGECCNQQVQVAQSVPQTQVNSTAPTPQGGEIQPGVYAQIADQIYTGPNGATGPVPGQTQQFTLVLNGSSGDLVFDPYESCAEEHINVAVTITNGELILNQTCPTPPDAGSYLATFPYTVDVDAGTLLLFGGSGEVHTLSQGLP